MKYVYPAVFTWYEPERIYIVTFPDADNWFTDGYSLSEALEYATDVLNLMLWDAEKCGDPIPEASKLEDIKLEDKNSFAQYIYADTELYGDLLNLRKILDMKKRNKANRFRKIKKEVSL
ncbi:MAG: type II toxin-antitoxin system HicB family antitoxin [Selenomonadaceae bacterium]|nr:type II toxin-antitoxin system HicB family antitoxin [Selenomonadaceae bacterium]MBQ9496433.1 type II toxin-antitoxin system HicB family antitoxin [Selenomonadaceae bacterium]